MQRARFRDTSGFNTTKLFQTRSAMCRDEGSTGFLPFHGGSRCSDGASVSHLRAGDADHGTKSPVKRVAMSLDAVKALRERVRADLWGRTLPFWMRYSIDAEHGGFFNCLDEVRW